MAVNYPNIIASRHPFKKIHKAVYRGDTGAVRTLDAYGLWESLAGLIINILLKKARTPLGFCDGLRRPFIGFGDDNRCQLPKYHSK